MSRRMSWRRRAARSLAASVFASMLAGTSIRAGEIAPAIPQAPLGGAMHGILQAQVEAAAQDHFVFYELEWMKNTAKLGPAGRRHLARVMLDLAHTHYPLVIETHPDAALNLARRTALVNLLAQGGVPRSDERVVLGESQAEGLYGEEAVPIYSLFITSRFRTRITGSRLGGLGGVGGLGGLGGLGGFGLGGIGGVGGVGGYGFGAFGGNYVGGFATPTSGYRGLGY